MISNEDDYVISEQVITFYSWVVYGGLCQIISLFGTITNIINIICLTRQGFADSVNISLLGLSVSDLGSLLTMILTAFCFAPAIREADLPFDFIDVTYLTTAMTHFSFTRVSSCITAMITLERCLCITIPLKIKRIITPEKTAVITVFLFIISFCTSIPVYIVNKLDMKFSPLRNKTILGVVSTHDREAVEKIYFAINNFSIPFGAFAVILICTVQLSLKLRINMKWRMKTISSSQDVRISTRNQKTSKMVVMISTLFIICFIPTTIIMLAIAFLPELSISGKYMNVSIIAAGLSYTLESINSSINIFIYYYMSSKYRNNFPKLSCLNI